MAKHQYVPKEAKWSKVGGVAGGLKKSGADMHDYTPCHIKAGSSAKAGMIVNDELPKPKLSVWEDGNPFLKGKKNQP